MTVLCRFGLLLLLLAGCGDVRGEPIRAVDGGLRDAGPGCRDNAECETGFCYADLRMGELAPPSCQPDCIAPGDTTRRCDESDDCCAGATCTETGTCME